MTPDPSESFESWSNRVVLFEKGRALQKLARGDDIEIVMEDMSRRIIGKLLYPVFQSIKEASPKNPYW